MKHLLIDGQPSSCHKNCRYRVVYDGQEYYLQGRQFEVLLKIALGTIRGKYAHLTDLGVGLEVYQSIYLLRRAIPDLEIISNGTGCYRLNLELKNIWFNRTDLVKYPNHEIRKIFE